uniref:FAM50A/XAP5 C-terminal domain-containing protein n=1 Tax=Amorphochlora amoebiformis TaxID=1561963 RepID=A0A7S0DTP9_9EUKA|mmetsp:Transcript_8656/g.13590  ORF Transcript_8656/g.13590 Transcript_8656/m.13590 type:complete len:328 (+) Transcript_8656:70-1053(+)
MCAHYKGTNADGNRAAKLAREREAQKKEFDRLKKSIEDENKGGLKAMDKSFTTHSTAVEDRFKASTVGLVTAEDFKKKRRLAEMAIANEKRIRERAMAKIRKKRKKERKRALSSLSFATEGEEGEDEEEEAPVRPVGPKKKKKTKKCPFVDTSFLPDKDREDEEIRLREELKREWKTNQERMKKDKIEVTYSYWDGSGHRRVITVPKGLTILKFLERCRRELTDEFHELRGVSSENLMYIKEDVIIPHTYTFYDLIVSKARGKSGPLFHFDVHDDVRLVQDTRVEKDESHAGKIITRAYYERNKHIFPVNRWEPYDPNKKYEKYTIR